MGSLFLVSKKTQTNKHRIPRSSCLKRQGFPWGLGELPPTVREELLSQRQNKQKNPWMSCFCFPRTVKDLGSARFVSVCKLPQTPLRGELI